MAEILQFPKVHGNDLTGKSMNIPEDFQGKYNLIFVPFQMWHQNLITEWAGFVYNLKLEYPILDSYELPILNRRYKFMQSIIDGGMRGGIPSIDTRQHTITLYIDKKPFEKQLNILNEKTVHLFLINKEGSILWHNKGGFTEEKGLELKTVLGTIPE
jgi:hypothetical protein